ncbi:MAG: hypothetical protein J6W29_08555 [Neisseriaceae bacterium]|nr:hypothetical protein [Neisseriaceae bacterium]MBO7555319.1 hypothetical protein [Neisseriaceae bacterium]MBP5790266.1 hypothetical protein [Neisseriaceae bacterium]
MSLLTEMQANVHHLPLSQLSALKETIEEVIQAKSVEENRLSNSELRALFDSFTGSINRSIDEKQEKLNYLDERYASFD